MGYRKVGYLEQLWYVVKYAVSSFFEWQDAKHWAMEYHPAWVQLATKSKNEKTRKYYRFKILNEYRRLYDGQG